MIRKILLVDDNKKVRLSLREQLTECGYQVTEAVNGLDGLMAAKQDFYDGFVIDHKMPIMDGITLIRDLRELSRYSEHPMVILTTGSCDMLTKSLNTYCVEKPADVAVLDRFLSGGNSGTEQVA